MNRKRKIELMHSDTVQEVNKANLVFAISVSIPLIFGNHYSKTTDRGAQAIIMQERNPFRVCLI